MRFPDILVKYRGISAKFLDITVKFPDIRARFLGIWAKFLGFLIYKGDIIMDWFPRSNDSIRQMCTNWMNHVGKNKERLGVSDAHIDALVDAFNNFMSLFMTPSDERTPAMNTQLRSATKALETVMRDFKKRHFLSPPLEDHDYVSLTLKIPDKEPTPVAAPTGTAEADIIYLGGQQIEIRSKHVEGTNVDHRAEHGIKIAYGLYDDGDTLPIDGDDLRHVQFTRHKKHILKFTKHDIKKTLYVCLRYENAKGEAGPWGPMISAIIP